MTAYDTDSAVFVAVSFLLIIRGGVSLHILAFVSVDCGLDTACGTIWAVFLPTAIDGIFLPAIGAQINASDLAGDSER